MSSRMVKLLTLFFVFSAFSNLSYTMGARLASGEYGMSNGSFEDTNSMTGSGWMQWIESVPGTFNNTINMDSSNAYYGGRSLALYRSSTNNSGCTIVYQELDVVSSGSGPEVNDTPEAGIWVMFDSAAAGDDGQIVLEVKSIVGGTINTIASSVNIANKQAGKWYYLMTNSDTAGVIPAGADKIQIAIISWLDGTVYVDFAQSGKAGSITGNPSKLALAEYHTWFGIPEYLPDWRRYTDPDYDGFESYDPSGWKHWFWEWDPCDTGYNNDPAFYEQIGIKSTRKYTMVNSSFESDTYGSGNGDWNKYPPSGSSNIRTTEKAYDGSYSVKFINNSSTGEECSMWESISCNQWNNSTGPNIANEREYVQASVMINADGVNLAAGKFWIQVLAISPSGTYLIAKSYEYLSPDYIAANKDSNGWVQIKTRPVNKADIPDGTTDLQVAVKFYYNGTIYIDKVEVGEAEYSNVQRQTACAKHPKPKIGPYDSSDTDLLEYHLKLCKSMLFDAMLVDYYGSRFNQENYQRAAFNAMVQMADDEDMKVCTFYEPKVHLKQWADVNYYAGMTNVSEMNSVDTARVNAYIDDVTVYNNVSEISDINLVKHYIKMAAIEDDIKYILDNWGGAKSYLTYRGKPVVAVFGMNMGLTGSGAMNSQDWSDIAANLQVNDGSYKFILIGDSSPDIDDASGWYNVFTGMMNWHLLEDSVQDRMFPTEEYIYERSRDVINGRSVNWSGDGQGRFAVGLTYPQFNDLGVGAWDPQLYNGQWNYHINRTPNWNGDFYRNTNDGVMYHIDNINWLVVATFNDWNEGTAIEPSVEDGYLYPIITQELIEDFKGIADEPNNLMEQITDKYINMKIKMDVDTNIEQQEITPTGYSTYYKVSAHQFDSSGGYLGELVLKDWSMSAGTFTSNFSGHHANLAQYVPSIRISTASGAGWIKVDQMSEDSWTEDFSGISDWLSFETAQINSDGSLMTIKDADGNGGAQWNGARIGYTAGDVLTIVVSSTYDGIGSGNYYSGAACLKTALDYEGFNEYTQQQLHTYAISHNISTDQNVCADPTGMYLTMNNYKLNSNYNYSSIQTTSRNTAYNNLCYWMSYKVPNVSPRPEQMPAMLPLNGGYKDWVVVNGYVATGNPHGTESYTVNGFWITDPDIGGLGKNLYLTAADVNNYYQAIDSNDAYDGYYVLVAEPPVGEMADMTIAAPKAYKGFDGSKKSIVKAAMKGIADNRLRKNDNFKSAFGGVEAGKPILVNNNADRYYIVPFIKNDGCTVAVIVDAVNGAFRQAAYSDTPDSKYLERFNKQTKGKFKQSKSGCRKGRNAFLPNANSVVDSK